MKRFSLKLKLTAMYSFFMVLVTCLCLAVLFSLSGNEILTSAQMHLRERVQESADEIELEDGEFEIDSDFYSLDNNVYLALYDTGGNFLYGKVPPGLEQAPQFEDGKIQTVKSGTEQWYPDYEKAGDVYNQLAEHTAIAIQNAKRVEQYHLQNDSSIEPVP